MAVTLYGASDDLIEIEGDLEEEFYLINDDHGDIFAFSDGTLVRVQYTRDGIWSIQVLTEGTARSNIDRADGADEENYSDRLTLKGEIRWVVQGINLTRE